MFNPRSSALICGFSIQPIRGRRLAFNCFGELRNGKFIADLAESEILHTICGESGRNFAGT
jgi:hypothetical protein